jgi:SAM-dependent methyltransferase
VPAIPLTEDLFSSKLRNAWEAATFVKLTLSDRVDDSDGATPRKLKARPVELKEGRRMCVVECFQTREVTKNHAPQDALRILAQAFVQDFSRAHLFTTTGDFQFRRESSGKVSVRASRPAFAQAPDLAHDKRNTAQDTLSRAPFLQRLGVTNSDGSPRPGMSGKLRQVQRFVEVLGHLLQDVGLERTRVLRVADMGAGKGYLTFALAHAFRERNWAADVVGVELRPELVANANEAARELEFAGLHFVAGSIGQWHPPGPRDVLVALHACNTATDDALFLGIQSGASLLVTSPCCHQELRPQMRFAAPLLPIAGHGILEERQAEIVTDAVRAHLLEIRGYDARVFEFVEPEHSGKNLMLAGVRRARSGRSPEELRVEMGALWAAFGLRSQRLAGLLGEEPR